MTNQITPGTNLAEQNFVEIGGMLNSSWRDASGPGEVLNSPLISTPIAAGRRVISHGTVCPVP